MVAALKKLAEEVAAEDHGKHCRRVEATQLCEAGAFLTDMGGSGSEWVRQLEEWSGEQAVVVKFGTNAAAYPPSAVRTAVVMGPGSIEQAHQLQEFIEVAQLERMQRVVKRWWGISCAI